MVRAYEQFRSRQSALAKNTFMTSMKDQNVVLYYKVFTTARSVVEAIPYSWCMVERVPHQAGRAS